MPPMIPGLIAILFLIIVVVFLARAIRVKKKLTCPKNQWTTIVSNFGTGMPRTIYVHLTAKQGSTISGKFLEKKYFWIFPKAPTEGPLEANMTFHRDWINGIYKLQICPDSDVDVVVK